MSNVSLHPREWLRRCTFLGNIAMNEPVSTDPANEEADPSSAQVTQALLCPRCQSERIETRSYGKKIGGALGAAAGIGSGMALVLSGADIRAAIGSTDDPVSTEAGGLAQGVLAILRGGSAGCAAGAAFGNVIDEHVLDRYSCVECGHAFSKPYAGT